MTDIIIERMLTIDAFPEIVFSYFRGGGSPPPAPLSLGALISTTTLTKEQP
ncbi:hypothetical protein [Paenibacillus sp.]|uniref:hypothetical protein n=1 Tax=Paenibacillus sp. TaxID=58172 RepID=UPI002D24938B|nr:hypothetical protein [Paenibacillus sp.]HZG55060.1 hypothetical protein [Paenibacillus sp.]